MVNYVKLEFKLTLLHGTVIEYLVHCMLFNFCSDVIMSFHFYTKGRGIPNTLSCENDHTSQIHFSVVPTLGEAVNTYESTGGSISLPSVFGTDPLAGHNALLSERQRLMEENIPTPKDLFSAVVNGVDGPFAYSLQFVVEKTLQLESLSSYHSVCSFHVCYTCCRVCSEYYVASYINVANS